MAKIKITWELQQRRLEELLPYEFNPRKLTEKGMKDLKQSIDKFGLAEPIIINKNSNVIIGGHARYFTLLKMKQEFCDCYVPDTELTPKEMQELNIRLNKNIAGDWDFNILSEAFELPDLQDWGFEEKELDLNLWNKIDEEKLDDVPEVQKEAVSRLGDLFLLGDKHRVLCGDSTKKEDVELLMGGAMADMVFTDPPWNVAIGLDSNPRHRQREGLINDKMDDNDFNIFLLKFIDCVTDYLQGDLYCVLGNEQMPQLDNLLRQKGFHWSAIIIWVKDIFVLGRSKYHRRYEPIWYGWLNNKKSSYCGSRDQDDTWEFDRPRSSDLHPTMKPIPLICKAILNSSTMENIILDSFLGSGSTLIACEQTNGICYGMEIDPIYIDVILRRYYNLYPEKKIECLNREFDFSKLFETADA